MGTLRTSGESFARGGGPSFVDETVLGLPMSLNSPEGGGERVKFREADAPKPKIDCGGGKGLGLAGMNAWMRLCEFTALCLQHL